MSCTAIRSQSSEFHEVQTPFKKNKKTYNLPHEKRDSLINFKEHVLFVDDSSQAQTLFKRFMEKLDFKGTITIASDGVQAVEYFIKYQKTISLIFMDILMPNKDGIAATKEIRELEKGESHIPIVCISSGSDKVDNGWSEAGMDAGMGKFLTEAKIFKAFQDHCM